MDLDLLNVCVCACVRAFMRVCVLHMCLSKTVPRCWTKNIRKFKDIAFYMFNLLYF